MPLALLILLRLHSTPLHLAWVLLHLALLLNCPLASVFQVGRGLAPNPYPNLCAAGSVCSPWGGEEGQRAFLAPSWSTNNQLVTKSSVASWTHIHSRDVPLGGGGGNWCCTALWEKTPMEDHQRLLGSFRTAQCRLLIIFGNGDQRREIVSTVRGLHPCLTLLRNARSQNHQKATWHMGI